MIIIRGKDVGNISIGTRAVAAVYKGMMLVWERISSCFGKGYWVNDAPWDNDCGWRND